MSVLRISVLAGYLGAGKSTLLNRLLMGGHGLRIAVIQNEFGEVPVDNDVVVAVDDDGMITLANGCACCTVRDDMIEAVERLMERRPAFDHLVIEASGLATPGPIVMTLLAHPDAGERFQVDGVITVVDARYHAAQMMRGPEVAQGIAYADAVVLNKADLVSGDQLAAAVAAIREVNPVAELHVAEHANVDTVALIELGRTRHAASELALAGLASTPGLPQTDDHHHHHVTAIAIVEPGVVDPLRLEQWIDSLVEELHGDLYRIKGIVNVAGAGRRYLVQGVHGVWTWEYTSAWGEALRSSRLVLIGHELPEREIRDGFGRCIVM